MNSSRVTQAGILIAGGLIILVVLAAFLGLTIKQNQMIRNYIHLSAQAYFESIVLTRRWNAEHGGVYVLKAEGVQSNPYLEKPDITTVDGKVYTKKNPALMTREISALAKEFGTYQYQITSLKYLNPVNKPDPWETVALNAFEQGSEEVAEISEHGGKKVYRLMQPLYYEEGCVSCHAKQGYRLGDVRGGISVALPYGEIEAALKGNQKRMMILGAAIVLVMGITFYLLIWQLMRRLSNTVDLLHGEKRNLEQAQNALVGERNKLEKSQQKLTYLLEDVNEAKAKLEKANMKLQELDRLKSMFIASMSHELRTPLNSIIGFSGIVLQGKFGKLNDKQKDHLSRVYHSGLHLLDLISDVIDISKIEAGRIEVYTEEFSLPEIVDEAIMNLEPQLKAKDLALEVDLPAQLQINTDRKRLLQAIINFLSNAVKFTEQGTIKIVAREVDGEVDIRVSDTGIGISKEDFPKLFEAFERLESRLRIKAGGTGLGLYLTHKLVTELLKGKILVKSELGQGSTFGLIIPKNLEKAGQVQ